MVPRELVQVLEAGEDFVNRISAVLDLQKVEKRLQLAASSHSLLERSEVGPEGGSVVVVASAIGVAAITHVSPTPRGP